MKHLNYRAFLSSDVCDKTVESALSPVCDKLLRFFVFVVAAAPLFDFRSPSLGIGDAGDDESLSAAMSLPELGLAVVGSCKQSQKIRPKIFAQDVTITQIIIIPSVSLLNAIFLINKTLR
jgi:hypothetical protein